MKYFFSFFFFIHFLSFAQNNEYKEFCMPEYYLPKNSLVNIFGNKFTFSFTEVHNQKITGKILIKDDLNENQIKITYDQDLLSKIPLLNRFFALFGLLNVRLNIEVPNESIVDLKIPEGVLAITSKKPVSL